MTNYISWINGPVIRVINNSNLKMQEMVYVGPNRLMGEVIGIEENTCIIQVYESTTGLKINDEVVGSDDLLSVTLGPGLLENIYDGIQRPLALMFNDTGAFIGQGNNYDPLDYSKEYEFTFTIKVNDVLRRGQTFATTPENDHILHYCLFSGHDNEVVIEVKNNGKYHVNDKVLKTKDSYGNIKEYDFCQRWPIRIPRPLKNRQPLTIPLITGQRVIDTLFPIAKGGASAIPGGFGAGKTMLQHQLAKYCDADIIVYVGCGERGNEMTQVLKEFGELIDPKTNQPLTKRTILIANTSNMPVAAREASIYTGISFAEYYRDMGYHVALMADSTSRWAEALREISGRLEEMPAEEGFPAYLPSRLAAFYERSGYGTTLNDKEGSVTLIGAVSPAGGDFSEPVTQNTKRFVRAFWALDKALAYARHFPSVNWNQSYSEYIPDLSNFYSKEVDPEFMRLRNNLVDILNEETRLNEIVKLIGMDVLPDDQKAIIEISKVIRVGYLQQNAYHPVDTYIPLTKQYIMMKIINYLYQETLNLIKHHKTINSIIKTNIFDDVIKMKYEISNDDPNAFDQYRQKIDNALNGVL